MYNSSDRLGESAVQQIVKQGREATTTAAVLLEQLRRRTPGDDISHIMGQDALAIRDDDGVTLAALFPVVQRLDDLCLEAYLLPLSSEPVEPWRLVAATNRLLTAMQCRHAVLRIILGTVDEEQGSYVTSAAPLVGCLRDYLSANGLFHDVALVQVAGTTRPSITSWCPEAAIFGQTAKHLPSTFEILADNPVSRMLRSRGLAMLPADYVSNQARYEMEVVESEGVVHRGRLPLMDDYLALTRTIFDSHVVFAESNNTQMTPVGTGFILGLDLYAGSASIGVVLRPAYRNTAYAAEATLMTMALAFSSWPLRKVYLDLSSEDSNRIATSLGRWAPLEAHVPGASLVAGLPTDRFTFAIDRALFAELLRIVGLNRFAAK